MAAYVGGVRRHHTSSDGDGGVEAQRLVDISAGSVDMGGLGGWMWIDRWKYSRMIQGMEGLPYPATVC